LQAWTFSPCGFTRGCTCSFTFRHKCRDTCFHIWIYNFARVVLHVRVHVDLHYCTRGIIFFHMRNHKSVHVYIFFTIVIIIVHKIIYILQIKLRVCAHVDLYICTRWITPLSTRLITLVHTCSYSCEHTCNYILPQVELHDCTRWYIFRTCISMYAHVYLYFCK
jgi:hypothetical protein